MGSWVVPANRAVAPCSQQSVLVDKHSAYWNLALQCGLLGALQGLVHPVVIVVISLWAGIASGDQLTIPWCFADC
jgi:hypothetical protein